MRSFLVTGELGYLAKWMRLLGYDTEYTVTRTKSSLLIRARSEERVILTRDKKFSERVQENCIFIISEDPDEQLKQVISAVGLEIDPERIFSICLICNKPVANIPKEEVREKVPEYVFNTQDDFVECPVCHRIYWQGTHWENTKKKLAEIMI